jgi:hypothetical protein
MGGAGNGLLSPSVIEPIAPAQPLLYYNATTNASALTYVSSTNNSKLVYLEFAFEAISGGGAVTSGMEFLNAILNWFEPATTVQTPEHQSAEDFRLLTNYPNPFNSSTSISFELPVASEVSLKIFDLSGREVSSLVNGHLSSGEHQIEWKADGLASGIYFMKLEAGNFQLTKKLLLLR